MSEVDLGKAQPKASKKAKQPKRRAPQSAPEQSPDEWEAEQRAAENAEKASRAAAAEPVDRGAPLHLSGERVAPTFTPPANPYAPVGWKKKQRVEFDLELPSGQRCKVARLERDDLLRLDLMQHLDTFTPLLLGDNDMSDDERQSKMTKMVQDDPVALNKMLKAIDKVVMACTIAPAITEDKSLVNYGGPENWADPNFVATVHIDDVDTFERMFIFGAAFGRSMDDLKSILEQAEGVDGLAD